MRPPDGRARDREVHRRARSGRRLHRERRVPGDAVGAPRPRLRIVGASLMTSLPGRDPGAGPPPTPQNAALVLIDYQPSQIGAVKSMDRDLLIANMASAVKTAKAFRM